MKTTNFKSGIPHCLPKVATSREKCKYFTKLWLFLLILAGWPCAHASLVTSPSNNAGFEPTTYTSRLHPRIHVARGRSVYLEPSDLFIISGNADTHAHIDPEGTAESLGREDPRWNCRVRVKPNEPIAETSGEIHPRIFNCGFASSRVRYTHKGSPFTNTDIILLEVYHLSPQNTTHLTILVLHIEVMESPYDVIVMSHLELNVDAEIRFSGPLDSSVLMFSGYGYGEDSYCSAALMLGKWPRVGQIVKGLEYEQVHGEKDMSVDCRDILHASVRYRYLGNATQHNVDYIPLCITYYNGIATRNITRENYYLPVRLPIPDLYTQPRASKSIIVLDVTEYEMTVLDNDLLKAMDSSNRNEYVMYQITYPDDPSLTQTGIFLNENDPITAVTSFSQNDLTNGHIGYYPRVRNTVESIITYESIEFKFTAYNAFLQPSQTVTLRVVMHNNILSSSDNFLIVNKPLVVNEASSTLLSSAYFLISSEVMSVSPETVEFTVKGGLRHGSLELDGVKIEAFTLNDILQESMQYVHDGSRAPDDRITLRMETPHGYNSKIRLPVLVLPLDDSTPQIEINKEITVKQGGFTVITSEYLLTKDRDSESSDIVFHVKAQPRLGQVKKSYHALSRGVEVDRFTQEDVNNGYIFYHHSAPYELEGATYDMFEVRLSDAVPNKSGSHIVGIKIVPRVGTTPDRGFSQLFLETKETDVAFLTHAMLQYISEHSYENAIRYTVMTQPFFVHSTLTVNAGRLIAARNMSSINEARAQRADIPALWSFTQEDIDTQQVAYLPPLGDTGPVKRHAQFVFAVTDHNDNNLLDQVFDITITPVNNRAPQLLLGDIRVKSGQRVTITRDQIQARDQATEPKHLTFALKQLPRCGRLLLGTDELVLDSRFPLSGIHDNQLSYWHDDCTDPEDGFVLLLSDGSNSITAHVPVYIEQNDYPHYEAAFPNDAADVYMVSIDRYAALRENSVLLEDGTKAKKPFATDTDAKSGINTFNGDVKPEEPQPTSREEVTSQEGTSSNEGGEDLTSDVDRGMSMVTGTPDQYKNYFATSSREVTSHEQPQETTYENTNMFTTQSFLRPLTEKPPTESVVKTSDYQSRSPDHVTSGNVFSHVPSSTETGHAAFELFNYRPIPLTLLEGGSATLGVENLALTRTQTAQLDARLSILAPSRGDILLSGRPATQFTMEDVRYGRVSYRHRGGEIGPDPEYDVVSMSLVTNELRSIFSAPKITMNVTILPVDNQRPTILIGDRIYAQEGEVVGLRTQHVLAQDVDTRDEHVRFHIQRQPHWGYVENMRLSPTLVAATSNNGGGGVAGSVAARPMGVDAFSFLDLKNGYINYVQSNHTGVEPVEDVLVLYASDGTHNSLPAHLLITIMPVNDEMPRFQLKPILLDEGATIALPADFVQASDLDRPEQRLVLSLSTKPRHGQVFLRYSAGGSGTGFEIPMNDVTINDIQSGRMNLVYKHDGSETREDAFTLQLTDGVHVARRTARVSVMPQNDEVPELVHNSGLSVQFGASGLITNRELSSRDRDNDESQIQYELLSGPHKGVIQQKVEDEELASGSTFASLFSAEELGWEEVPSGSSFTQIDINNKRVRYVHTGSQKSANAVYKSNSTETSLTGSYDSKWRKDSLNSDESDAGSEEASGNFDKFLIQISDGKNKLPPVSFDVDIVGSDSRHIALLNRGLKVREGEWRTVTADILSASEEGESGSADQLVFRLATQPRFGRLSLSSDSETVLQQFTQADIEGGRLIYAHTSKRDVREDAFRFTVINARNHTRIGIFKVIIEPIDRIPPSLDRNMPLTVTQDEAVPLTSANLHISDPDTPPSNLTYLVLEPPHFGRLLLGGVAVREFTQQEVDEGLVQYENAGSNAAGVDYFHFIISDGHNSGFRVNGTAARKQLFFNILVQPPERKPPSLLHVAPPTALEALGNGRFGFIFTSENLKSVHPKRGSDDVVYSVQQRPQYGYLQNLRELRTIRKKFSQKDVDEGNIAYVLTDNAPAATADNFTFCVMDAVSQSASQDSTFEMSWSVVEFTQDSLTVCEDAGWIHVVLERRGESRGTVQVDYKQKGMSASVGHDFRLLTNTKRVIFKPGDQFAAIDIQIFRDDIRDENEKFRLKLKSAKNAVIGPKDKLIVQIVNQNELGKCDEYIGMISKDDRDPLGLGYDKLFADRNLSPAPQTTTPGSTTVFDVFDYGLQLYEDMRVDVEDTDAENDVTKKENTRPGMTGPTSVSPTPIGAVPQDCTSDIRNLLFFDMKTSKVFKCDGINWIKWGWGAGYVLNDQASQTKSPLNSDRENKCERDWTAYDGHCYKPLPEKVTWDEGQELCGRMRAHLVEISSHRHLEWLWYTLINKQHFWIGLSGSDSLPWRYSVGGAPVWTNWKRGYPRAASVGTRDPRQCALVTGKMWWVDRPCGRRAALAICQI